MALTPDGAAVKAAFAANMAKVVVASEIGARVGLSAAGAMLTAEIKRLISQPYPPASVAGEPPHQRRGQAGGLLSAYDWALEGNDTVMVGASGNDAGKAAAFLEGGTSRMKPRPHVRPAVANLTSGGGGGQLHDVFAQAVAAAIRGAV